MRRRDPAPNGRPRSGRHRAQRIRFRIGVNLGDVIVEGNDIYGDGVNIAARLEALAEPGGICISGTAFDHAVHKVDVGFASLGEQRLKNIADPVRVYRVLLDPAEAGKNVGRATAGCAIDDSGGDGASSSALLPSCLDGRRLSRHTAFRRRAAVRESERRSGPGLLRRRHHRGFDHRPCQAFRPGCHRAQLRFAYKGRPVVLADVARDLGVRYVVEGSVRRAGEQIRINAQLIDTATGDHLWADRFDRGVADVFAVQDEMSRDIVKALGVRPSAAEKQRMARPPTANLEAYDYYLRGEQAARTGGVTASARGAAFYERAVALDPPSPTPSRPMPARPSISGAIPLTTCCKARRRASGPTRRQAVRCN